MAVRLSVKKESQTWMRTETNCTLQDIKVLSRFINQNYVAISNFQDKRHSFIGSCTLTLGQLAKGEDLGNRNYEFRYSIMLIR